MSKITPGAMTPGEEAAQLIITAAVHGERLRRWLTEPAYRATRQPMPKGFASQGQRLFTHLEAHLPEEGTAQLSGHSWTRKAGPRFGLLVQVLIRILGKENGTMRADEIRERSQAYRAALDYLQTKEGTAPTSETLTKLANVFAEIERRGDEERHAAFARQESPLLRKKASEEGDGHD